MIQWSPRVYVCVLCTLNPQIMMNSKLKMEIIIIVRFRHTYSYSYPYLFFFSPVNFDSVKRVAMRYAIPYQPTNWILLMHGHSQLCEHFVVFDKLINILHFKSEPMNELKKKKREEKILKQKTKTKTKTIRNRQDQDIACWCTILHNSHIWICARKWNTFALSFCRSVKKNGLDHRDVWTFNMILKCQWNPVLRFVNMNAFISGNQFRNDKMYLKKWMILFCGLCSWIAQNNGSRKGIS